MDINYNKNNHFIDRLQAYWAFVQKNWFNAILFYLAAHVFINKNISIQFGLSETQFGASQMSVIPASHKHTAAIPASKKGGKPGFSIGNLTPILSPDYGERKGIPKSVIRAKVRTCQTYIKEFAPVAIQEMEQYGIPASITLAQGLLESNAGESSLATESLNHFGIKCRSKCKGCTCRNYADDDAYDMFRVFDSVWDSYREHSLLLANSGRYRGLFGLEARDYEGWAYGLKAAGYATDKNYAKKLVQIIETLKLYKYDN